MCYAISFLNFVARMGERRLHIFSLVNIFSIYELKISEFCLKFQTIFPSCLLNADTNSPHSIIEFYCPAYVGFLKVDVACL